MARAARRDEPSDNGTEHFAGRASRSSPSGVHSALMWLVASGASSSMTPRKDLFVSYSPRREKVQLADDSAVYTSGVGDVECMPVSASEPIVLRRVLHVPDLGASLLNPNRLARHEGYTVTTEGTMIAFRQDNEIKFTD